MWGVVFVMVFLLTVLSSALIAFVPLVSMVYHLMCGRPPSWIGEVTEKVHSLTGKPVWPIIQSVDQPLAPLSAEEYGQALDVALLSPASEGVLVFQMESALDGTKLEVTKSRFGS